MQIHVFVAFSPSAVFHEARATPFDLNAASSLLLNMLDICATVTNDLSTKVKTRKRLEINYDFFFRPFTL
jgi:hypothetical protein